MDFARLISEMSANARSFTALAEGLTEEQARWRPAPEKWSILEVVNHMLDEEKEDFRVFLDYTLHKPGKARPKISPQNWVADRKYNERDLDESLQGFLAARESSLEWLRSLASPDWEATYHAPWGQIKAGDIFAAWVAHDLLHTRQLVTLRWKYLAQSVKPYGTEYAGEW